MMQGEAVYQRTENGRAEIKNKSHGLTQSERQALIMLDGFTSCEALGRKLTRLSPQRLEQILAKLDRLGLIAELLLAPEVQTTEVFEEAEIERFLHQDVLDPVTIISFDPDREFDPPNSDLETVSSTLPPLNLDSWVVQRPAPRAVESEPERQSTPATVDFYLPLNEPPDADNPGAIDLPDPLTQLAASGNAPESNPTTSEKFPWEYWAIGLGVWMIAWPLLARYWR